MALRWDTCSGRQDLTCSALPSLLVDRVAPFLLQRSLVMGMTEGLPFYQWAFVG